MPQINVRRTNDIYRAVHTTEEDWKEVVAVWLNDYQVPEEQAQEALATMEADVAEAQFKPWLVASPQGLAAVPPQTFVSDFEDVAATDVLSELFIERQAQAGKGYTHAHDDVRGLGHLISEAVTRLSFGEEPTEEQIRRGLIEASAILVAAIDLIDRKESKARNLPEFYSKQQLGALEMSWVLRVNEYIGALDDLQGQAQDEENSTPEDAIGWARAQFEQIFKTTPQE